MKKAYTRKTVFSALFAAAMAICAQIIIPTPWGVPYSLQTAAVMLCGFTLGGISALSATAVYIGLGAIGLPVFSSFSAGLGTLFNLTGGFIWGFVPLTAACAFAHRLKFKNPVAGDLLCGGAGLVLCHLCGIIQYAFVTETSFWSAALVSSLPFVLKDALLLVLSVYISPRLKKELNK